jgi:nucleoside-diphosphate-sugar epimerase
MRTALPLQDLDLVLSLTPAFWSRFGGARVLLTGGTGFIGLWLLEVLQRANDKLGSRLELVVLTRDPQRAAARSPHLFDRPDTTLVAGDICRPIQSAGSLDLCIHAATDVGDALSAVDPIKVFDSIVQGTRHVLDLAVSAGTSRFLLTSSGAVYGTQPITMDRMPESYMGGADPLQPRAAYGNGKRAAEWLACAYASQAAQGRFESCIARIFALVGPGLPFDGPLAAGNFVRDVLAGRAIDIKGDGSPLRSYLYMADLCIWLLRILDAGKSGQAYNVGSEQAVSIADLAGQVVTAAGTPTSIHIHTPPSGDASAVRYVPDTHKARHELGLAEYTPLHTALLKTIHWSRSATAL